MGTEVGVHVLVRVVSFTEHAAQHVMGLTARTDRLLYAACDQYETMAGGVFTAQDLEQEQASGTGECHVMSCDLKLC